MAHAQVPVVQLSNRRAYSLAEVAAVTGFSQSFLYELIKSGALRSRKVAGRRIVTAEAFADLLGESTGIDS
jgi:excisionase family DNA binding protein